MKLLCSVLAAALSCAVVSGQVNPPLYKQCDPRWGANEMGTAGNGERATICREGCAMSSVSMGLAGLGVTIPSEAGELAANPGSLNAWLESNQGYTCAAGDCNNLVLEAPTKLTARLKLIGEAAKPSLASLQASVLSGKIMHIAHVHNSGHFVLLTGVAPGGYFTCNDPFYETTAYPYANISDLITYSIEPEAAAALPAVTDGPPAGSVIPKQYPLYKQCDSRWGSDLIYTETVCAVGCLMSSTSMALGGHDIAVSGQSANPGDLNAWLKANHGYTQNDLIESAVPKINPAHVSWPADAMHTTNDLSLSDVQYYLHQGRPVIANVMDGHHFVLVTGWVPSSLRGDDTLVVNDPGFERWTYSLQNDVVGWRLFNMTQA